MTVIEPGKLDLLNDCVHCGFCLSACPTYSLWGEEADSPRGRIDLMRQGVADGEPLTPSVVAHVDRCLGCMACVPACPSGVQYDRLIETTRAEVEAAHRRPMRERLLRGFVFRLFPYRRRLAVAKGPLLVYQRLRLDRLVHAPAVQRRMPATLRALEGIAPRIRRTPRLAARVPAAGTRRAVVGMLTGCVQSAFFGDVNAATARVLAAEGCEVVIPRGQGCCGALSAHNGRPDEARKFARGIIDTFEQAEVETVIVNSAGCGSTMKEYADLLKDDPDYAERAAAFSTRTRDVVEFLHEIGPVAVRHELPLRIAYHDACHLSNAQRVRSQPRAVLAAIPGVEVLEIPDGHLCCGSAGVYNLLQPEAAGELGDRKADNVRKVDADVVVAANPGCLLQITSALGRQGAAMATAHTITVLDASIRGLDPRTALDLGA
jgi:glycolate oxidase iron-sulfur subunit